MEGFTGVLAFAVLARFLRRKTRESVTERAQPNLLQRMGILSGVRQSRELSKDEVFQELKRLGLVWGHHIHCYTQIHSHTCIHVHIRTLTHMCPRTHETLLGVKKLRIWTKIPKSIESKQVAMESQGDHRGSWKVRQWCTRPQASWLNHLSMRTTR